MDTTTITVRDNAAARRFELVDNERVIGRAHYLPHGNVAEPERIFYHTVVDEGYGGQGLGSKLATFAVESTVAAGLKIVPVCPYINAFLGRHREYAEHVLVVRPEHLDAVDRA
jgi:uncharacterized protein